MPNSETGDGCCPTVKREINPRGENKPNSETGDQEAIIPPQKALLHKEREYLTNSETGIYPGTH